MNDRPAPTAPAPAARDDDLPQPVLTCRGLTKAYGPTTVLDHVDLDLFPGEVLAVLGENGAGKSTLMRIVSGLIPAQERGGSVELRGQSTAFNSIRDGEAAGVVMVPQELHVVPHLSIAENMFASALPSRVGFYDKKGAVTAARAALASFSMSVDVTRRADVLSPSERRLIVLAAALHRSASVLILDEPTAALTDSEAATLIGHLRRIRDDGVAILYITHRLDELNRVADRSVVLRNGKVSAHLGPTPDRADVVKAMLGNSMDAFTATSDVQAAPVMGDPTLSLRDFTVQDAAAGQRRIVDNVNLDLFPGEVVGLYGLVGAGRTELARALFGMWPGPVTGTVQICGLRGRPKSSTEAVRRGISLLVEDRKSQGVLPGQSVATNINASMLGRLSRLKFFRDIKGEERRAADLIRQLGVHPATPGAKIGALSGGNQQKVLLGRCLRPDLKLLILDEPTLGVDVGARRDLYELIRTYARESRVAVLMISSDVEEIRAESDRVLVMYKGRLRRESTPEASAHDLLAAATGA